MTDELDTGSISDGFHTFDELYEHRFALFVALINSHPQLSWKSKHHYNGTGFPGWFIAGMRLPTGDITYHLPDTWWDKVMCIPMTKGLQWDGHTAEDVVHRLSTWEDET